MLNLARGEQSLQRGDFLAAAHALALARQGAKRSEAPAEVIQRIDDLGRAARSRIGALRIDADPGSTIDVDGVPFERVPLAGEVLVAPGQHQIIARGPACLGTKDIDIRPGQLAEVFVSCRVGPAWRKPVLVTSAVLGAAALAAGLVSLIGFEIKDGEIDRLVSDAQRYGYVEPYNFERVRTVDRERADWLNASITSFVIGGGGIAAAVAMGFAVEPRRPAEPPKRWGVTVGPGSAGLWMRW